MQQPITTTEHGFIDKAKVPDGLRLHNPGVDKLPVHLGLDKDCKLSYYIGADWLTDGRVDPEKDIALVVRPKFENIDYASMFSAAFEVDDVHVADYFSSFFAIDFDKPWIEAEGLDSVLTPLIITIFTASVKNLLYRGLMRGYVEKEENLNCHMKGKLLLSRQIRGNDIPGMKHKMYCRYSEYTYDIPPNRLIKKALLFSKSYLAATAVPCDALLSQVDLALTGFIHVGEEMDPSRLRGFKENKLYKGYGRVLQLAKLIFRRFDYNLDASKKEHKTVPVFWIDMPRLFEMHVLSILRKSYGSTIRFQVSGYRGRMIPDYIKIDEPLILDAKYKPYDEDVISKEDIREVAGNSRDLKIRSLMGLELDDRTMLDCIILYCKPDAPLPDLASNKLLDCQQLVKVDGYIGFYELAIPLPLIRQESVS